MFSYFVIVIRCMHTICYTAENLQAILPEYAVSHAIYLISHHPQFSRTNPLSLDTFREWVTPSTAVAIVIENMTYSSLFCCVDSGDFLGEGNLSIVRNYGSPIVYFSKAQFAPAKISLCGFHFAAFQKTIVLVLRICLHAILWKPLSVLETLTCLSIFPVSCLWFFLEPLTKGNDNYSFLRKLLETIKQTVDTQDPDAPEASKVSKKNWVLC